MTAQTMQIGNKPCRIYGGANAEYLLLQMTGEHELQSMDYEVAAIAQSSQNFLFAAIPVESWNDALSPWKAPAVWGKQGFGGKAGDTLRFLTEQVIPTLEQQFPLPENVKIILGGYSLAGLFALWASTQTDLFYGVAAASSSVWFPGWMEFEQHAERETRLGLLQKLSIVLRFNRDALRLFFSSPEQVIPYLQSRFYVVKRRELESEKRKLTRKLEHYAFDAKMDELTKKSLRLFRAELAARYPWKGTRKRFEEGDFRRNSAEFTREYPVVLSTTYSIKGTLSIEHVYDYLIVDEASQVDLTTGVLAFSCARNIVIVGI